jgi:hypothetical protein
MLKRTLICSMFICYAGFQATFCYSSEEVIFSDDHLKKYIAQSKPAQPKAAPQNPGKKAPSEESPKQNPYSQQDNWKILKAPSFYYVSSRLFLLQAPMAWLFFMPMGEGKTSLGFSVYRTLSATKRVELEIDDAPFLTPRFDIADPDGDGHDMMIVPLGDYEIGRIQKGQKLSLKLFNLAGHRYIWVSFDLAGITNLMSEARRLNIETGVKKRP